MPIRLGPLELVIVLAIVLVLFGGRLSRIGGDLGRSIREFRRGLKGEEEEGTEPPKDQGPPPAGS
jgi:sec-independent protein translocase protein TatA